ncbi:MAG: STAS domain-containing protein [Calditrichaceae bacterium]
MKIKESIYQKVAVLSLRGKLMGSPETKELYDDVCSLIQDGVIRVVFDLTHLNWINSMGMGMIMKCLTTLNKADGHLRLVGLSEKTRSVFVMTQLINVFIFHDSVNAAVDELNNI